MTGAVPPDLLALGARLDLLVEPARGDARRLAGLALAAQECGRNDLVYPVAREARALAPHDPEVLALTQDAIAAGAQTWHVQMLKDEERYCRYRAAIERAVRPGDLVLDIGAGTGVRAMTAARAGAMHVFSCEAVPGIADVARDIVALNGFADRVTIIPKRSTQLDPVADLGRPVDVLVSEVLGSDVIGENVLPTIEDAAARLLKPGGRMVPVAAEVVVALAEVPAFDEDPIVLGGFDLSPILRLTTRPQLVTREMRIGVRSEAATLFHFDFTRGGDWGAQRVAKRLVAAPGRANGVVMWMRLTIDEHELYDSFPVPHREPSWLPLFYRFERPGLFGTGDEVAIEAVRRTAAIHLWKTEHPA